MCFLRWWISSPIYSAWVSENTQWINALHICTSQLFIFSWCNWWDRLCTTLRHVCWHTADSSKMQKKKKKKKRRLRKAFRRQRHLWSQECEDEVESVSLSFRLSDSPPTLPYRHDKVERRLRISESCNVMVDLNFATRWVEVFSVDVWGVNCSATCRGGDTSCHTCYPHWAWAAQEEAWLLCHHTEKKRLRAWYTQRDSERERENKRWEREGERERERERESPEGGRRAAGGKADPSHDLRVHPLVLPGAQTHWHGIQRIRKLTHVNHYQIMDLIVSRDGVFIHEHPVEKRKRLNWRRAKGKSGRVRKK